MKFKTALRSAMAQEIVSSIASGTTSTPKLQIYDGAMPSEVGGAIAGNLLAELGIANTVGTIANGVLTFDSISDDSSANASGDPSWARIIDRDGGEVLHLTASAQGGSGEVQVNPGTISAGEPVTATLGVIRAGV